MTSSSASQSPQVEGHSIGNKKKRKATDEDLDHKKRQKTSRACDSCRSRKIRCDVLVDSDPQICKHCKQYGFECTFFLPITETRFKKKKNDEEQEKQTNTSHTSVSHPPASTVSHALNHSNPQLVPARIYESYDEKYHHAYEVSQNSKGFIQVSHPDSEDDLSMPTTLDPHVERDAVERLLNAYFTDVVHDFPVVTREEFLSNSKPDPFLLYSMCLVAAARRDVEQSLFESIRFAVNTIIKAKDVLSTPSLANVQGILILCMSADCHSQFVPQALSSLWIRLGAAIRMAQDLGLHRAENVKDNIVMRRRLWAACIVADRWTAMTFGHPSMISVEDCDACLPCSGSAADIYMSQLVRLSLLVGRINRAIYGQRRPSGLASTSDENLTQLLEDLESYKERLPDLLQYRGSSSSRHAGLIHLLYSCACTLFWRTFMRISYRGPQHLSFRLTPEKWSLVTRYTGEAITWLDKNEFCYDVWMAVAYAGVSCALVQYHSFARQRNDDAVENLRVLRDVLKRWETSISSEHMSARRKTAEIVTLLYEATQSQPTSSDVPEPPKTDTSSQSGLQAKDYQPDPSKPNSGLFIAKPLDNDSMQGITTSTPNSLSLPNGTSDPLMESSAFAPPLPNGGQTITDADIAALFGSNVNPIMNTTEQKGSNDVQILNALGNPQPSSAPSADMDFLNQMVTADMGYLEGLPAGLWNFPQWDEYFTRFNPAQPEQNMTSLT
ncbi:fungal-specific transcription factor domain-containing protein [Flagelloscypha sp. PMI_526]|nr:fungal-specific transcription factor domain-containing protein [Flagelloscypha sp. PMI_526]